MDKHLINIKASVLEGLRRLNELSGGKMTLFVTDDSGVMRGTLLTDTVDRAMHTGYRAIIGEEADVADLKAFRDIGIRLVPWLNPDGTIKTIVDLSDRHTILPLSAIVMAGGKGERMRPLTLTIPKPLLPIGGRPIIDYNIEALARCGITDITVTTRYLAEQIEQHFSIPRYGVQVKCVKEDKPLGTIGSAALADIPAYGNTIVMNSDLLTTISFEDMYLHHLGSGADITVAVIPYQVSVPYAILTTAADDHERVTGIREKPSYSYFANAGIYIMPNSLLRSLDTDARTDATDLIELAIAQGMRVTQFPVNGTWIDVGSPVDFRQATELVKYVSTR